MSKLAIKALKFDLKKSKLAIGGLRSEIDEFTNRLKRKRTDLINEYDKDVEESVPEEEDRNVKRIRQINLDNRCSII